MDTECLCCRKPGPWASAGACSLSLGEPAHQSPWSGCTALVSFSPHRAHMLSSRLPTPLPTTCRQTWTWKKITKSRCSFVQPLGEKLGRHMLQSWEIPGDDAGSVGVFCRQGHCDLFNYKPQSPAEILEWEAIFELVGRWLSISEHLLLLQRTWVQLSAPIC